MKTENSEHLAEIAITYKSKVRPSERQTIKTSQDAFNIMKQVYDPETIEHHEQFFVFLVNRANHVLGFSRLSHGGMTGTVVDVRIVLQLALKTNACGIILTHNHPSGQLRPSEQDLSITRKIKEAAKLFDIAVLDHVIMTSENYYSLADNGHM